MQANIKYDEARKPGRHLQYDERVIIQTRLKDGWSIRKIAIEIGCSPTTVSNEIQRGTVILYNGSVARYKTDAGQRVYEEHRKNSCHNYDYLDKEAFIQYVKQNFHEYGWSLDACFGRALAEGIFDRSQMVCTKTLYNYVDLGLIEDISNIDLPEKVSRNTCRKHSRQNKRILGRSIEDRSKEIETREEFGHWEADLVIGQKSDDKPLLTLLERKTRELLVFSIEDKTPESVMGAFEIVISEYGDRFDQVFKTITTDNGSEFAQLSNLEDISNTLVYSPIHIRPAKKAP